MLSGAIYLLLARCITSNRMFSILTFKPTFQTILIRIHMYMRHFTGSFSKCYRNGKHIAIYLYKPAAIQVFLCLTSGVQFE